MSIRRRPRSTGYIKISSPELTATDLIQFENKIGGFNRVVRILHELIEKFENDRLKKVLNELKIQITSWSKLGFILDNHLKAFNNADLIYMMLKDEKYFRIALSPENETKNLSANNRWKVIENINIESDL